MIQAEGKASNVESGNDWTGWPEKILGVITAVGGIVVFFRKWLGKLHRAIVLLHAFGHHFGPDAPATIARLLENVDRAQGSAEIERRLLAEHLGFALYVCDPSGACAAANEPLCELFGLDSSSFSGFGWLDAIVERFETHEIWMNSVKNGLPYRTSYHVINKRTGKKFLCETRAYAVTASDETVVCYIGYVQKIKEIE